MFKQSIVLTILFVICWVLTIPNLSCQTIDDFSDTYDTDIKIMKHLNQTNPGTVVIGDDWQKQQFWEGLTTASKIKAFQEVSKKFIKVVVVEGTKKRLSKFWERFSEENKEADNEDAFAKAYEKVSRQIDTSMHEVENKQLDDKILQHITPQEKKIILEKPAIKIQEAERRAEQIKKEQELARQKQGADDYKYIGQDGSVKMYVKEVQGEFGGIYDLFVFPSHNIYLKRYTVYQNDGKLERWKGGIDGGYYKCGEYHRLKITIRIECGFPKLIEAKYIEK